MSWYAPCSIFPRVCGRKKDRNGCPVDKCRSVEWPICTLAFLKDRLSNWTHGEGENETQKLLVAGYH